MIIFNFKDKFSYSHLLEVLKENNPNIVGLDIRGNFTPKQFIELFETLKENNTVKKLILRGKAYKCDLDNKDIYSGLSSLLQNNKTIEELTLYHTGIQDDGVKFIAGALEENNSLKYLKICGHYLKVTGEIALLKMLAQNTSLETFAIDYISETAKLALLAQPKYFALKNLDITNKNSGLTFFVDISNYENLVNTSFIKKINPNPIAFAVEQKELQINKLAVLLENENFSQAFIKATTDFYYNNFLIKEKELAAKYASLDKKKSNYENTKHEVLKEYNNLQLSNNKFFTVVEKTISVGEIEAKQTKAEIFVPKPKIEERELVVEEKEPAIEEEIKLEKAVVKKLDIDNGLKPREYITEWTNKIVEMDYDTVILSIGSGKVINQQIPPFSNGLGQVAILNIDTFFSKDETENVSNSNKISVNYLSAQIENIERYNIRARTEEQKELLIKQEKLADSIYRLIDGGKKVILLSHISPLAPRTHFEKVLKNKDIMNGYGDKFLFINSYFDDMPTILCRKGSINSIMSPNMKAKSVMNKYIYTGKAYPKGEELEDIVVYDRITSCYDICKISFSAGNKKIAMPEGMVYSGLSEVTAEDVMHLMGHESIVI